ncbi:PE family protein [Mycobacterium intermedium]|uniref:PE family protein n=1 Tax=Mycobacterium intermedium TaxID=28445 RepID=UPI000848F694|nr:PE family protein [Mycobacterium intermedium]ODR02647.1 hypothetical protein BHQ20_03840 [Mycobacterium intermedium]
MIAPDFVACAVADLANLGEAISAATAAVSRPTSGLLPAAADEISVAIANLFSEQGQAFQALSTQTSTNHVRSTRRLNGGVSQYVGAEAAAASPLNSVLAVTNTPTELLLGRPLIGDGADGTAANPNGGDGGLLYGNGGNGYSDGAAAGWWRRRLGGSDRREGVACGQPWR